MEDVPIYKDIGYLDTISRYYLLVLFPQTDDYTNPVQQDFEVISAMGMYIVLCRKAANCL